MSIQVWRTDHMPADWKDGIIVILYYKQNGARTEYGNADNTARSGMVFAHVLLAPMHPISAPQNLPTSAVRHHSRTLNSRRHPCFSEVHRATRRPSSKRILDINAAFYSQSTQKLFGKLCARLSTTAGHGLTHEYKSPSRSCTAPPLGS